MMKTDTLRYPKVLVHWSKDSIKTELVLLNRTVDEAVEIAQGLGYTKPAWYARWLDPEAFASVLVIGVGVLE